LRAEAEEQLERASEARTRGDLQGAIESLSTAVQLEPGFAAAYYHLGAALWYAGNREEAAAKLDTSLRLNPASEEAHSLRSLAYREAGDLESALRHGRRAIALNPKLAVGYFDLGVLFLRMNRLSDATGQFEAGLNVPGLRGPPPDIDVAIRELREALGRPERPLQAGVLPHIVLARMLGLAGAEPKQVIAEFEAALRIEPGNAQAHNGLGLVYTQINQDDRAIAAFREAVRLYPGFADAHGNLGAILTATDVAAAVRALEKAVELDPALLKAHYNLAIAYGSSPQHGTDREIEQLQKLLAIQAGYPRADFALGKALLRKGAVADAVTHLERAAQLDPQFGEAQYQLGLALSRAGRAEEAAASLKKGRELIASSQRDQDILIDVAEGKAALEKGNLDDAIAKFRRVLRARPDLQEVQQQLDLALAQKGEADDPRRVAEIERYILDGKFELAKPLLEAYVKARPKSSWGWYALGYSLFGQRQISEAVNALSKSLSLDITNANAHKVLGRVFMMIGRFDAAQREFEIGEKYDSKSAELPYNLGRLFSIQDQWVPARDAFQRAVRLDPAYMEAFDGLGFALESLGEDDAAIANYLKAAQINQERNGAFATPYVNLSALHNKSGNSDQALEFAKKAVAVNERSDRGWYQMARAYDRRGEAEAAADALKRAIAINGNVSSYYYVLATVYRRLGRQQESREAIEAFTRLDRESREIEQKRREAARQGRE
jgi:superkiller protein 3